VLSTRAIVHSTQILDELVDIISQMSVKEREREMGVMKEKLASQEAEIKLLQYTINN